jgi:hypothetical protein
MPQRLTVTLQLPIAVSSCACRGRRRALLHASAQKEDMQQDFRQEFN